MSTRTHNADQIDPLTPVIIGVGQTCERLNDDLYRGLSAVELAAQAAQAAINAVADTTVAAKAVVSAIHTVAAVRQFEVSTPSSVAPLGRSDNYPIKQVAAGVDVIVAQGTEAGGHCGEVTTLVLVPEVVAALAPISDVPVLAAGGIVTGRQMAAAIALGAAGAWTGSVWLTTREAETAPYTVEKILAATSRDTVRSAGRTGKPSRQLISDWTDAWLPHRDGKQPLPMPLQTMLAEPVLRHVDELATRGHEGARALATYWVGQGIGLMNDMKPARDVVQDFIEDYLAAAAHLGDTLLGA